MAIDGRAIISISIKKEEIPIIIDKLYDYAFEEVMVHEGGIEFLILGDDIMDYSDVNTFVDWLIDREYSFVINIEEWIHNENGGYYFDTEDLVFDKDFVDEDV